MGVIPGHANGEVKVAPAALRESGTRCGEEHWRSHSKAFLSLATRNNVGQVDECLGRLGRLGTFALSFPKTCRIQMSLTMNPLSLQYLALFSR